MGQTFKKEERLKSTRLIEELFSGGRSFFIHPFKTIWIESEPISGYPVQVAISVPKKRIKKATLRNRIKRLVREAYRKNKHLAWGPLEKTGRNIAVMLIYVDDVTPEYKEIENKIILILQRLKEEYEKHAE